MSTGESDPNRSQSWGERTRLSQLRTRHQSRGVGYESNHDRNCDMSELRLVWADRNTSCRSSASEEADFIPFIALRRNGSGSCWGFFLSGILRMSRREPC